MKTKYGLMLSNSCDIDLDEFEEMVAVNAYYRAEKRGFEPGHELEDWHAAELEIANLYRYLMRKPGE